MLFLASSIALSTQCMDYGAAAVKKDQTPSVANELMESVISLVKGDDGSFRYAITVTNEMGDKVSTTGSFPICDMINILNFALYNYRGDGSSIFSPEKRNEIVDKILALQEQLKQKEYMPFLKHLAQNGEAVQRDLANKNREVLGTVQCEALEVVQLCWEKDIRLGEIIDQKSKKVASGGEMLKKNCQLTSLKQGSN